MTRRLMRSSVQLIVACAVAVPAICEAQAVSGPEREALVRLRVERGGTAADLDALIRLAEDAGARGLPVAPLTNKIREGLAKGHAPARIEPVVRQMVTHLEMAGDLIREIAPGASPAEPSVTLLAESFGSGVTSGEIRELERQAMAPGKGPAEAGPSVRPGSALSPDMLAAAAKGLSFIKDARLPVADGTTVIVESIRQGYRAHDVLDLGREVKRREDDFRTGRASLRALRDAIARGDRPDRLFSVRPDTDVERPAGRTAPPERPERPLLPERPQRPERPVRPERPGAAR